MRKIMFVIVMSMVILVLVLVLVLASPVVAWPQALTYTPPQISAYKWTGSAWTAATSTATSGAITFTPPPAALYCFNASLGTSGQWVPADPTCLGGGGSGVTSLTGDGVLFNNSASTGAVTLTQATAAANTSFGNFTGSTATPTMTATTGTGSPVSANSPTLVTPALGTPSALVITNATGTCTGCTANVAGSVTNALTLNNSNSGAASGTTYNGSAAVTLSANTLGAGSLANANTWSAAQTLSVAGAASVSPFEFTGAIFTGGNGTTTFPYLMLQPSTATAETGWSTSGTFLGVNSASGFAGNFLDFHVNNAASVFSVSSAGSIAMTGTTLTANSATVQASVLNSSGNFWKFSNSGTATEALANGSVLSWSSTANASGTQDTGLDRNAAGVVEVNLGTAAGHGGSLEATGIISTSYQQVAASNTGGTCSMSTSTSCTITIGHTYTTPVCIVTQQSATLTGGAAGCTVSSTTVTITAAVANSETWGAFVFGNPN